MPGTRQTVVVPASDTGIGRATEAFEAFIAGIGVPDHARRRFLVALDEALSNIVRHGRPQAAAVSLTFTRRGDVLEVELADSTHPFNPLEVPSPDTTAPLDARQPGGLGIALVRAVMDDVRYERRDGQNVLTLSARIHQPPAGE